MVDEPVAGKAGRAGESPPSEEKKRPYVGLNPREVRNPYLRGAAWGYWLLDRLEWGFLLFCLALTLVLCMINIWQNDIARAKVVQHLIFYLCLSGGSLATRSSRHISIDVGSRFIPERYLPALRCVLGTVAAIVCIRLTSASWEHVSALKAEQSYFFSENPVWYWQEWIWKIPLLVFLALISFHFVVASATAGYKAIAMRRAKR